MQYLLNKDRQRHHWQPKKSVTWYPDFLDVQVKQLMQTQVNMKDAPTLLKIPKSECPGIWIRLPKHKWPKSWSSMEDPVVPLERKLYGYPLARLLWERQFEKVLVEHGWDFFLNGNVSLSTEQKDCSYLCVWTISKWHAEKKNETDLENSNERRWSGRTNPIPRPRIFGLYAKSVQ